MLIDDARARELLTRIVHRLTADRGLREDLMQEAQVHLWLLEERRPRQSRSWYLQNCKFHLQNRIAAGKSIDSLKRSRGKVYFLSGCREIDELATAPGFEDTVVGPVSMRDIIALLSCRLTDMQKAILIHLAEGLRAREIASRLKVSHPTVINHRRKIAALAIKLGVVRLPKYQRNHRHAVAAK